MVIQGFINKKYEDKPIESKLHLITTAEVSAWPSNKYPCLFLGEWCKTAELEEVLKKYKYSIFPYHFDNREKLYDTYEYCTSIYEKLLDDLANAFNNIYGIDNQKRYWRIILGFWLWSFIVVFYDRYLSLKNVLNIYPDIETNVLKKKSYFIPKSSQEFHRLVTTDKYNFQIYSQIWIYLNGNIRKTMEVEYSKYDFGIDQKIKKNKLINFFFIKHFIRLLSYKAKVFSFAIYFPKINLIKWILKTKLLVFPFELLIDEYENNIPEVKDDIYLRNKLQINLCNKYNTQNKDEFYDLCIKSISANIPVSIFERFPSTKKESKKLIKNNPRGLMSANGFANDLWNILVAEKVNTGTKLINLQHGGGYGIQLFSGIEDHEISISDYYLTWGWIRKDNKTLPLPNPEINSIVDNNKRELLSEKPILIIGNDYPRYFYRLFSHPIGKYVTEYRSWFISFLDYLDDSLYNDILIRLYPIEYDSGNNKKIINSFPEIELDDLSITFNNRLLESKIIISDTNQTTYLQSLAINKPTIIFWNPKSSEIRPNAKVDFAQLKAVGIYHETPESAAEMVSKIYPNVDEWWYSPNTQEARIKFVNNYAIVSKNWINDWLVFVNNVIYNNNQHYFG